MLITCTVGQLGFDATGRAGNEQDHDDLQTTMTRAGELQHSAAILGFSRRGEPWVRRLGNDGLAAEQRTRTPLWNVNAAAAARTLASIFDEENA